MHRSRKMSETMNGPFTSTIQPAKYIPSTDIKTSFFDRPGTALHRVVEKMVGFTGLFPPSSPKEIEDEEYAAASEKHRGVEISKKVIPILKKLQSRNKEVALVEDSLQFTFKRWGKNLTHEFNQQLLEEFGSMFAFQSKSITLVNSRVENLFNSLNLLQEREKQISKITKSINALRDELNRILAQTGPKSSNAEAQREKVEVHLWNESIHTRQYERAISGGLKNSIYDYLQTLQSIGISLENEARISLDMLKNLELEFLEESPKKLRESTPPVIFEEPKKKQRQVDIVKDFEIRNDNIPKKKHRHFPGTPCAECDNQKHPYDFPQATRIVPDLNLGDYQPNESWY